MGGRPVFVVQRHQATHLHWDLRLEVDGVLASWAVPKEPTGDPTVRRLAVQVGDHDLAHATYEQFEGPRTVQIWDSGSYDHLTRRAGVSLGMAEAIAAGHVKVRLHGHRLIGVFALTRTSMGGNAANWLLVRTRDDT